jgi:hypothetical protein
MAGFAFSLWIITVILGTVVFVPLFVIALIRLPSTRLAFIVSASFSIGAMVGFFLSYLLASYVIPRHLDEAWNGIPVFVFVAAGAIGGAALALGAARRYAR